MWFVLVLVALASATRQPPSCPPASGPYVPPDCGPDEYFEVCPPECPPQKCSSLWSKFPCEANKECCKPACRCKDGYMRDDQTGVCVTIAQCLGQSSPCGINEKEVECRTIYPPQNCDISYTTYYPSENITCERGCDCIDNYLRDSNGICIPNSECPPPPIIVIDENPTTSCPSSSATPPPSPSKCGPNEKEVQCKTICPPQSCNISYTDYACNYPIPCIPGCDCIENYLRNSRGDCIYNEECPPPGEIEENPDASNSTSTPPKCGPNEKEVQCKTICPPQSCDISYTDYACNYPIPCIPGCDCIDNYLRNSSGVCIYNENCPPPGEVGENPDSSYSTPTPPKCGPNEKKVKCKTICPPQSCDISYTEYDCNYHIPCIPGCDCIDNYLRNSSGVCIYNEECPPPGGVGGDSNTSNSTPTPPKCGLNEKEVQCKTICPPQSCNISYTDYACNYPIPCIPGCDCIYNYLRNSSGVCIYNEDCPPPGEAGENPGSSNPNASSSASSSSSIINRKSSQSQSQSSSSETKTTSSSKVRVKSRTGNSNPKKPPPVTCSRPNEEWNPCATSCLAEDCSDANSPPTVCNEFVRNCHPKCVCKKGYFRNESGICVPAAECETKCGANQTYVQCVTGCPNKYCPSSDYRGTFVCGPTYYCPPGCACRLGYRRKSYLDDDCILAEDCPPVNCTRPNEKWNPCPSCLAEDCADVNNQPTTCNELVHNCQPKCVCEDGFFRDKSDNCVPKNQCPQATVTPPPVNNVSTTEPLVMQCAKNETYVQCNVGCPNNYCPTTDSRGILICDPAYPCPPGCSCKLGYRRKSYDDNTCILAEECPAIPCARPNEKWNPCPSCLAEDCADVNNQPTTCNELVHNCQPRCVCENGFFRNASDICVPKDQCAEVTVTPPPDESGSTTAPPETQCGGNETYVQCNVGCPNSYCPTSDSRGILICDPPYPCPPGCSCKLGYRRKSYDDNTCILAEECPAVPCTRPHEKWHPCPSCLAEDCRDVNNPPGTCNEIVHNCQPKCICEEGFFRNENDVCVPANECGSQCAENQIYVPCNANCPSDYCPEDDSRAMFACDPPNPCSPGCICGLNHKKVSYNNETCIVSSDCPPVNCTRPNEEWSPCPSPCLRESCRDVNDQPSTCNYLVLNCQPTCVCSKGYFRNENDICVPAAECPPIEETTTETQEYSTTSVPTGETNCGTNETRVDCTFECSYDFCPEDDSRVVIACKPPRDCPSGCGCKLGYRRLSNDNDACVLAEDCPPVNCTRPNEKYDPCPSACLAESCEDVDNQPSTCNELVHNCQPKCVCEDGYFRNKCDVCVLATNCYDDQHEDGSK